MDVSVGRRGQPERRGANVLGRDSGRAVTVPADEACAGPEPKEAARILRYRERLRRRQPLVAADVPHEALTCIDPR
jgi:hypothetical protein